MVLSCVLSYMYVGDYMIAFVIDRACVLVDKNGDSIGVTVYNLAHSFQFNVGDVLVVPNPILSHVHIPNLVCCVVLYTLTFDLSFIECGI